MKILETKIRAWHEKRFGPRVNLSATYRKLLEEVGELGEALINQNQCSIREEAGDVALVLCHILRGGCPAQPELHKAMAEALEKCEWRMARGDALQPGGKHKAAPRQERKS